MHCDCQVVNFAIHVFNVNTVDNYVLIVDTGPLILVNQTLTDSVYIEYAPLT